MSTLPAANECMRKRLILSNAHSLFRDVQESDDEAFISVDARLRFVNATGILTSEALSCILPALRCSDSMADVSFARDIMLMVGASQLKASSQSAIFTICRQPEMNVLLLCS